MSPTFIYNAKISSLGPKNFLTAEIDLGFGLSTTQSLRIRGITGATQDALAWMSKNALGRNVTIKVVKNELGYSAEILLMHNSREINLSEELLRLELASLLIH